ncbi:MAG: hypothetical protein Q6365_000010, partial [Candidatus Sigynarchaeota archaeon]
MIGGIVGMKDFLTTKGNFVKDGVRIDLSLAFPNDAKLWRPGGALDQLDAHLLKPTMKDSNAVFRKSTRRVYATNEFLAQGSKNPINTIVIRPHSQQNIFVEFGFQRVAETAGHVFNVYVRAGHVSVSTEGYPPLIGDPKDETWAISFIKDDYYFDNFPKGVFTHKYGPEDHPAGPQATPAGQAHQVTLSYDQPSKWSNNQLRLVKNAFWKALRSAGFKDKTALFEIHPQVALYFARADHVYPQESTWANIREFLNFYFGENNPSIFDRWLAYFEAGFTKHEVGAYLVEGRIQGQRLAFFEEYDVFSEAGRVPTMAQTRKFYREMQLAFEALQALLKRKGVDAAQEFLGLKVMAIIGSLDLPGTRDVRDMNGQGKARNPLSYKGVPEGDDFDLLRSVLYRAQRNFAKAHPDIPYSTDAEIAAANAQFFANLFFHGPDGTIPYQHARDSPKSIPKWNFSNIPVLGWVDSAGTVHDEMIYVIVEAVRQAIVRATRSQTILGMEVTPATTRYAMDALSMLPALQAALESMLRDPKYRSRAGDAGYKIDPAAANLLGCFFTDEVENAIFTEIMKPLKAIFDHFTGVGAYYTTDILRTELLRSNTQKSFGSKLAAIMLNAIYEKGTKGHSASYFKAAVMVRLLMAAMHAGYERSLALLLQTNGLVQVGDRWRGPDGYEYFEVADGKGGPRMLCRAYQGELGLLHQGIEIFLDARLDGELSDYTCPASATGHLETGDTSSDKTKWGLKEAIDRAAPDQKMNAYQQWLAAHPRLKTKYLDEFYTHYAYPTT